MIFVNSSMSVPHAFPLVLDRADSPPQLEYASNLLYIGALWILKGVQFLLQFATTYPKPSYYIPAAVMAGMFAFLLAAAFECIAPKVWAIRSGKCYNQVRISIF